MHVYKATNQVLQVIYTIPLTSTKPTTTSRLKSPIRKRSQHTPMDTQVQAENRRHTAG
jgi:hypothetical protein